MKLRTLTILTAGTLLAAQAQAACMSDPSHPPLDYFIPGAIIKIRADAPVDTSTPISDTYFTSPAGGRTVEYTGCLPGEEYGKQPANLGPQDTATKLYPTNIPGIGIKLQWTGGVSGKYGDYPSLHSMKFSGAEATQEGRFIYNQNSNFRISFYKISEKLQLSNVLGDEILPSQTVAYNYVTSPSIANAAQKLQIGTFKLISTPVCNVPDSVQVDFGKVTPAQLRDPNNTGNIKPLDFSLTCKTDYGSYSVKAGITTQMPSPDGRYIKATDASSNSNVLGIEIYNSANQRIALNGSMTENSGPKSSDAPAEFNWKAKLIHTGGTMYPQYGQFSARAEIMLQID